MEILYEVYKYAMLFMVSIFSISTIILSLILLAYAAVNRNKNVSRGHENHSSLYRKFHNKTGMIKGGK